MDAKSASIVSLSAAAAACLLLAANRRKEERRRKRTARRVLVRRKPRGESRDVPTFLNEMKLCDTTTFNEQLRMDENCFRLLLSAIEGQISKEDTIMRKCVPAADKLSATLRFLATGENYSELDGHTNLSASFLQRNIIEICEVIYSTLKDEYLKFPAIKADWMNIAKDYELRWQFPLCLGALDGMHILFTPPKRESVYYCNYKGVNSIVLLALADAYGKFTYIDVGCNGRISNDELLNRSDLSIILARKEKCFPAKQVIGYNRCVPYVIVADNAFPLMENVLVPYPATTQKESEQVFNRRLNRARLNIQQSFSILYNRFRILQTKINLQVEKTVKIVQCCCVLHNFLLRHSSRYSDIPLEAASYTTLNPPESERESNLARVESRYENNRKEFMNYFCNEGLIEEIQ